MNPPEAAATYEDIDELVQGFRQAQVVLTASRFGLFDLLEPSPRSSSELASELQADPRGVRILCDALAALGVVRKSDQGYENSTAARRFLRSGGPESRLASLRHAALLYERWGKLYDSVRDGESVSDDAVDSRLIGDKDAFAHAMADIGRAGARQTVDKLDLTGVKRVLDIGGGPGIYALEFARRAPQLQVTLLDDEETLKVAQSNLRDADSASRIELRSGDAFQDELGADYDLIFLSNFIHIYSESDNRRLMERCAGALAPGGRIVIKDFILDSDRTSPEGAALFAVNMLVSTDQGDCYSAAQIEEWMRAVNLNPESAVPLTPQSSILIGRKPK